MIAYRYNGKTYSLDPDKPDRPPLPMSYQEWQIGNEYAQFGMHPEQRHLRVTFQSPRRDDNAAAIAVYWLVHKHLQASLRSWLSLRIWLMVNTRLQLWQVDSSTARLVVDYQELDVGNEQPTGETP